ncbi:MAG: hypothetical protein KatS3mg061_3301 [Dehalococcoidia bacterium]|nr:MAG: hypothetical protein KatS3mg061_3301 [Dehalococcoidia bacterium]
MGRGRARGKDEERRDASQLKEEAGQKRTINQRHTHHRPIYQQGSRCNRSRPGLPEGAGRQHPEQQRRREQPVEPIDPKDDPPQPEDILGATAEDQQPLGHRGDSSDRQPGTPPEDQGERGSQPGGEHDSKEMETH